MKHSNKTLTDHWYKDQDVVGDGGQTSTRSDVEMNDVHVCGGASRWEKLAYGSFVRATTLMLSLAACSSCRSNRFHPLRILPVSHN